jgi:hypothetical protein
MVWQTPSFKRSRTALGRWVALDIDQLLAPGEEALQPVERIKGELAPEPLVEPCSARCMTPTYCLANGRLHAMRSLIP